MPYRTQARIQAPTPKPPPEPSRLGEFVVVLVWFGLSDMISNVIIPTPLVIRAVFWVIVFLIVWFTDPDD